MSAEQLSLAECPVRLVREGGIQPNSPLPGKATKLATFTSVSMMRQNSNK